MIWAMIEALAETDRWAIRQDRITGELYVEDTETLRKHNCRVMDLSRFMKARHSSSASASPTPATSTGNQPSPTP